MLSNIETLNRIPFGPDKSQLHGKTVIVAGDVGGLGGVTAIRLAEQGARVVLAARSHDELEGVLAVVRRTGGQVDGMVVNFHSVGETQRFYDYASRYGAPHAVVNFLSVERSIVSSPEEMEVCAFSWMEHAVLCMQGVKGSQVINVSRDQATLARQAAAGALRRQARLSGVRVTTIEAGSLVDDCDAEPIADCVLNSLLQPFNVDLVYLQGHRHSVMM